MIHVTSGLIASHHPSRFASRTPKGLGFDTNLDTLAYYKNWEKLQCLLTRALRQSSSPLLMTCVPWRLRFPGPSLTPRLDLRPRQRNPDMLKRLKYSRRVSQRGILNCVADTRSTLRSAVDEYALDAITVCKIESRPWMGQRFCQLFVPYY